MCVFVCVCLVPSRCRSWKELSGSEKQQAATSFQKSDASKSGRTSSSVQVEEREDEATSAAGASTPLCRDDYPWERFGARYFAGTLKTNKDQGKERTVNIQVEV